MIRSGVHVLSVCIQWIGTWLDRVACSFDDIMGREYWILNKFLSPSLSQGLVLPRIPGP